MAYISGGVVHAQGKRFNWNPLVLIPNIFWGTLNFLWFFISTMFKVRVYARGWSGTA